MIRQYGSPAAFKQALEQRLRTTSSSGVDFSRRRQLLVFDRFLARLAAEFGDAMSLKGGLAVELRLERARTTKDVDLRVMGTPDNILARLRAAAKRDLGDFLMFTIRSDARLPAIQNDGLQYEGVRFRAECSLAGKVYGRPFGVDIAFGDPILGEPEILVANDTLAFAGIAPPSLRVYPVETHIAEKLHAYTMPRERPNSRVKDLPDLALLATTGPLKAARLRTALEQTFGFRGTHSVPDSLAAPPPEWEAPYATIAKEGRLQWSTLGDAFEAARTFLEPVLKDLPVSEWIPKSWSWEPLSWEPSSPDTEGE